MTDMEQYEKALDDSRTGKSHAIYQSTRFPRVTTRELPAHLCDADCAGHIDPETLCCTICGVDHNCECPTCGGHGFHKAGCAESDGEE
jgi:hypothetical protein